MSDTDHESAPTQPTATTVRSVQSANEQDRQGEARIVVHHSDPLHGEIVVPGAKNSVLKLMAASLLADGTTELSNVPNIADVGIMADLLRSIGLEITIDAPNGVVILTNDGDLTPIAPHDLVAQMRASINVLGPLLTRCGEVQVSMPGGDDFGSRPIDMHIDGLTKMGAEVTFADDYLWARADRLHGADVTFEFPSVGATENIMTAAVFADGVTTINNAAREPEIIDLCEFLVALGAKISGIGTPILEITGVERGTLRGCEHETVPDRIQAATYVAACSVTGGQLDILNARHRHMEMVLARFRDMGLRIMPLPYGIRVSAPQRLRATDVATLPYPGIATDYKPLIITMLSLAEGTSIVTENLYPGRFKYVEELLKLGAEIKTTGHHAVIHGVEHLVGAPVISHDIRAGAAMVVAGLNATGKTSIVGIHHIDRGYDDLVGRLRSVGATIERFDDDGTPC